MLSYGENASILLLSGNISYERVIEKVSSLEPILAQENDFLRNQGLFLDGKKSLISTYIRLISSF